MLIEDLFKKSLEIIVDSQAFVRNNKERPCIAFSQVSYFDSKSCMVTGQYHNWEIGIDTINPTIQISPVLHSLMCVCYMCVFVFLIQFCNM